MYVKISVINRKGKSTALLMKKQSHFDLKLNITAIRTVDQVNTMAKALSPDTPCIVSVFAGRIADTGVNPTPIMKETGEVLKSNLKAELLWASTRELLNLLQAESCGCHILTITNDILCKVPLIRKDLNQLSLKTVQMFYSSVQSVVYKIL